MFKRMTWLLVGLLASIAFGVTASQQLINLGAAPNDHTGDSLRSAGGKINSNFTELYGKFPVSALNGGTGVTSLGDLTKVNDTNVTLTLGGTPTGSLIKSTSLTLGWTGTLGVSRGGTGQGSATDDSLLVGNGTGFDLKALTSCSTASSALTYNTSTNAFGCNSISASASLNSTLVGFGSAGNILTGDTDLTYDSSTNTLTVPNITNVGALSITQASGNSLTLGTTSGNSSATLQAAGGSNLLLKTNGATRLQIGSAGGWTVNGSEGSSGNVLTSGGAGAVPSWGALTLSNSASFTGTLPVANGGTNLTAAADDNLMVGNGTTWQTKALTNCTDTAGNHLNYDTSTNTFSCGTSGPSGSVTETTGNFVLTFDDACSTSPTMTVQYSKQGNQVVTRFSAISGFNCTGDSANFKDTAADVPSAIRPTAAVVIGFVKCTDNGNALACGLRINTDGTAQMCVLSQGSGVTANYVLGDCVNGNWTNSGARAIGVAAATSGWAGGSYILN